MPWTGPTCDKCKRRMNIEFRVPDDVWRTVVLNRWRVLCPHCFDLLAEQAKVAYSFDSLEGISWSDRAPYDVARRSRGRRR